ncbi:MAG: ATP-grasp domain-containing protein [Methylococcaceae bacterium]|jgi:predicted ATP-grasp superfamily ATP-dependent carboligase
MKILVFEYITGGGYSQQEIPESLAREGRLMLLALLQNLLLLQDVELVLMLDERFKDLAGHAKIKILLQDQNQNCLQAFKQNCQLCDAVWPIAPEFKQILQAYCQLVEDAGKVLLTSTAKVVALTADKFLTWQQLKRFKIPTPDTYLLDSFDYSPGNWIVKPIDGVGCIDNHIIQNQDEFNNVVALLHKSQFIIQAHHVGQKTSLSCLFNKGEARLICVNQQVFSIVHQQYHLIACQVNYPAVNNNYLTLLQKIANAFPELWGYAGVDLIETPGQIEVLEINPRLTTSFVGIYEALGLNVAEMVLQLRMNLPLTTPTQNKTITVNLLNHHA